MIQFTHDVNTIEPAQRSQHKMLERTVQLKEGK
jgi:hypothetical protein